MKNVRTSWILGISGVSVGVIWSITGAHDAVIIAIVALVVLCLVTSDFD